MTATNNTKLNQLSNSIDLAFNNINDGFPIEVFPEAIINLINDASITNNFNADFFSAGILSACATAVGNSVSLFNGQYVSKPIFWLAIIGRSGIGKTHPLDYTKKPIEKKDKDAYDQYKHDLKDYNEQDVKVNKPYYSKFILKDFTPEKLAENLQYNYKGCSIFKDELIGWINSFDQYSKGGEQQKYLELFNGGTLTVDRKTTEPIRVEKTNVNIIGGMQPALLKNMASNNRDSDGFLTRFLFVYPDINKPNKFTGLSINQTNSDNYNRLLNNLFEVPEMVLKASASNIDIYKQWQHQKAKECFSDELETSIQAKLETYVWRLALIIELIDQASKNSFKEVLQDYNLNKAIKLIEYFRVNALRVNDRILSINPLEELPADKLELYKVLPTIEFKRSDILKVFEDYNIKGGSVDRFLKNRLLFKNSGYGKYSKKILA